MTVVAILFLVCVALRVLCIVLDDGFGGTVWNVIVSVSTLAWVFGVVMAISILSDIQISVDVR